MTSSYVTQLPGELNIEMTKDDDLTFAVTWNMDITGYVFAANIIPKDCDAEIPMGINVVNPSGGKMNVIISASSIINLSPVNHKWYLKWITPSPDNYDRTVLSGILSLRSR